MLWVTCQIAFAFACTLALAALVTPRREDKVAMARSSAALFGLYVVTLLLL